jgi:hypothetical protein
MDYSCFTEKRELSLKRPNLYANALGDEAAIQALCGAVGIFYFDLL